MRVVWPKHPALIASASMIQWLPDPALLLRKMARTLAPGGWMAVSGFGPEQYREIAQMGSTAKAPGLCKADDMAAAIQEDMEIFFTGESVQEQKFNTPREVLLHLRKTGVNANAGKIWTKSDLAQFTNTYTRLFDGKKEWL